MSKKNPTLKEVTRNFLAGHNSVSTSNGEFISIKIKFSDFDFNDRKLFNELKKYCQNEYPHVAFVILIEKAKNNTNKLAVWTNRKKDRNLFSYEFYKHFMETFQDEKVFPEDCGHFEYIENNPAIVITANAPGAEDLIGLTEEFTENVKSTLQTMQSKKALQPA